MDLRVSLSLDGPLDLSPTEKPTPRDTYRVLCTKFVRRAIVCRRLCDRLFKSALLCVGFCS